MYLNHAAAGVLPARTRDALVALVTGQANAGLLGFLAVESNLATARARVAGFIGAASGDDIAFLRNTGDGANTIARGLDWTPGDEIVVCDNEFGSNVYPWLALRELGVAVRFVATARDRLEPDVLQRVLTPRTRLVAVSWVAFGDGYRHDLAGLATVAHDAGALLCVDAIQALGAFPVDVRASGIDALYAGGAKWLLAVPGVSFLYVAPHLRERMRVRWRGWRDVADQWDFFAYEQPVAESAVRFEGGTVNFLGVAALETSLAVLDEAGVDRIASHVLALTDRLVAGLHERGARLATLRGPAISSGIVSFEMPGRDAPDLGRKLGRAGFCVTFRPTGIRVSPHGYNTTDDIDALLAELDRV